MKAAKAHVLLDFYEYFNTFCGEMAWIKLEVDCGDSLKMRDGFDDGSLNSNLRDFRRKLE
jgi:hypothetical protein